MEVAGDWKPLKLAVRSPRRRKTGPDSRHEKDTNIFRSPLRLEHALGEGTSKKNVEKSGHPLGDCNVVYKVIPSTHPSHVGIKAENGELC